MEDIIVIKLTKGAEIVGHHVVNPLNSKIVLDDALNVLMQPTEDGRVQIGLAPISFSIVTDSGKTGHLIEIDAADILTSGRPVPAVEEAYRQATSRIEVAHTVPTARGASRPNNIQPINRR